MKIHNCFWGLALLIISQTSCNQRGTNVSHSTLLEINASNCHATDRYLYTDSNIIESYDYIALETTEESLLGDISSVFFDDGLFFVSDRTAGRINRILVFDQSGKFITQIGRRGNGEGEYASIRSWTINPFENFVSIIDLNSSIKYYYYSGQYLKTIHSKEDFTCLAQYEYLSSGDILSKYAINWKKENDYILYTKDFKSKDVLWEHRNINFDGIYGTFMSNYLSVKKDKCYIMREFCDTVFALNKGKPEPVCMLSMIKTIPSGYSFKGQKIEELFTQLKEQKYSRLLDFVALDNYFLFLYLYQYQTTMLLWNIKENTGYLYSLAHKKEDQDPIFPNDIVGNYDNTLIGVGTSARIYSDIKDRKTIPEKLRTLLNKLKEDDNPVLLLYQLKD